MSKLNIYIPRLLGNINKKQIIDAFHYNNIGYASKLEMFKRCNNHNHIYYFGFIELELYDTTSATQLCDELNSKGKFNFIYDIESLNYWEIKKYIPRDQRAQLKQEQAPVHKQIQNDTQIMSFIRDFTDKISKPLTANASTNTNYSVWSDFPNIFGPYIHYNNSFTDDDKLEFINDYNNLQHEIYNYNYNNCLV
jgi:hypothetical protein